MFLLTFLFHFFPTHLARLMSIFIGGRNYRASASKFLRDSQGLSVCVCVCVLCVCVGVGVGVGVGVAWKGISQIITRVLKAPL